MDCDGTCYLSKDVRFIAWKVKQRNKSTMTWNEEGNCQNAAILMTEQLLLLWFPHGDEHDRPHLLYSVQPFMQRETEGYRAMWCTGHSPQSRTFAPGLPRHLCSHVTGTGRGRGRGPSHHGSKPLINDAGMCELQQGTSIWSPPLFLAQSSEHPWNLLRER